MGATAAPHLDNLPASGTPGLKVEDGFVVPWQLANGDRIKVTGTADFHVAPLDKEDDTFLLGDHKFIKSIARYAMSRQELADDVQANLYAHIFFERYRGEGFKNLDFVTKRWNYVQKEKEKDRFISKAVEVTNTREQVARVDAQSYRAHRHACARDREAALIRRSRPKRTPSTLSPNRSRLLRRESTRAKNRTHKGCGERKRIEYYGRHQSSE